MVSKRFMLVAGEASGDLLAAELVSALRPQIIEWEDRRTADLQPLRATLAPQFFGAGGPRMAAAGVELAFDLTRDALIGFSDVVKYFALFRRRFRELIELALQRRPHVIVLVDYSGFNLRLAHALKECVRAGSGTFNNWQPKIVYYVSPQLWASRQSRVYQLARDVDLVLSIFPFEKPWYAARVPQLPVEFVGHPIIDRYGPAGLRCRASLESETETRDARQRVPTPPLVLFLPGSRARELARHLPIMLETARLIRAEVPIRSRMILPAEPMAQLAKTQAAPFPEMEIRVGGLGESLAEAALAIAKSGTVTLECACFGVPAVVIYQSSLLNYLIAKQVVRVRHLAMPNVLAGEALYPEFIQHAAIPTKIARTAVDLLNDPARRAKLKGRLNQVMASLGDPGASERAAAAIVNLLAHSPTPVRAALTP
jgi:lipid-A-disaccharide synthase